MVLLSLTTARPLPARAVPGIPPISDRCTRSAPPLPRDSRCPSPTPSAGATNGRLLRPGGSCDWVQLKSIKPVHISLTSLDFGQ